MNIQESNKLIAEFMGWKPHPKYEDHFINRDKHRRLPFWCEYNTEIPENELAYEASWDWLNIVIEKIMHICFNEDIDTEEDLISWFYDIRDQIPNIESTYNDVVEFIKWYNKQQTKL